MKFKKIVAFGDSFVQGQIKLPHVISQEEMKRINFVTRLGEYFNIPVENYGLRGFGQNAIAFDVIQFFRNNNFDKEVLLLVSWSGYSRALSFSPEHNRYKDWSRQNLSSEDDFAYINNINIRGIHSLLTDNKQPFLMLSSFLNMFDVQEINLNGIESNWIEETLFEMCTGERKSTPDFRINHDNKNFYSSTHPNLSECMHPSEEGHKVIANKLANYIKEL